MARNGFFSSLLFLGALRIPVYRLFAGLLWMAAQRFSSEHWSTLFACRASWSFLFTTERVQGVTCPGTKRREKALGKWTVGAEVESGLPTHIMRICYCFKWKCWIKTFFFQIRRFPWKTPISTFWVSLRQERHVRPKYHTHFQVLHLSKMPS